MTTQSNIVSCLFNDTHSTNIVHTQLSAKTDSEWEWHLSNYWCWAPV